MKPDGPWQPDPKMERTKQALHKRIRDGLSRMILAIPEDIPADKRNSFLVDKLEEQGLRMFSAYAAAFKETMAKVREQTPADTDGLPRSAIALLGKFMLDHYAPEELEHTLRSQAAESDGWTNINEALSYEVSGTIVALHVPMLFTKKPLETLRLFDEGMHTLAQRLVSDPTLSPIKKIMGYSWIIYEHPKLLERIGFTVTKRSEEKREAQAEISREDFIRRYSN